MLSPRGNQATGAQHILLDVMKAREEVKKEEKEKEERTFFS
jgi:hypothetical protein